MLYRMPLCLLYKKTQNNNYKTYKNHSPNNPFFKISFLFLFFCFQIHSIYFRILHCLSLCLLLGRFFHCISLTS